MFRSAPEGDELQMNMVTISKQLNELMITEESEQVAGHYVAQPNEIKVSQAVMNTVGSVEEAAQYVANMCYHQQGPALLSPPATHVGNLTYSQSGAIAKYNYNISQYQSQQYHGEGYYVFPNNTTYPLDCPGNGHTIDSTPQRFTHGLSGLNNQGDNKPKCKFHYLTPQTDGRKVTAIPLLSITANDDANGRSSSGCFRKLNKHHSRYSIRGEQDYDKIVVDLSTLNILPNGKESNAVLRLFACLRNLHNALAEVPPSFETCIYSAYETTFAPVAKVLMPCTMNVQYQVKYASRKLASFFSGLVQIVANNRMYEQNLATEFDRYLFNIQPLLSQFELYKRLELEHKRGQFVSEDTRVHAERLEILLEKLTQILREVNLRVIAYDWYIGIKYRGKHCQKMKPSINQKDGQTGHHSKIGVINEILQMCNTTSSETAQQAASATKASEALGKSINPTTITASIGANAAVIQSNAQMNKTNETVGLGPAFAEAAAVICSGLSKTTSNTRQPVFYIG